MSEYSKILSACGWIEGFEELPLVAERIARYSAGRIEELEEQQKNTLILLARETAQVKELQDKIDYENCDLST